MKKGSVEVTNEFISNLSTRERVRHSLLLRTIALAKRRQKNPNEAARTE
jgi:hypothetical protein